MDTRVDEIAERIRAIGYNAPASLKEFLELTRLTEQSRETNNSEGFIHELLIDHESILSHLRENIHESDMGFLDASSSDYLTGLIGMHEKMAWMLRSHIA